MVGREKNVQMKVIGTARAQKENSGTFGGAAVTKGVTLLC